MSIPECFTWDRCLADVYKLSILGILWRLRVVWGRVDDRLTRWSRFLYCPRPKWYILVVLEMIHAGKRVFAKNVYGDDNQTNTISSARRISRRCYRRLMVDLDRRLLSRRHGSRHCCSTTLRPNECLRTYVFRKQGRVPRLGMSHGRQCLFMESSLQHLSVNTFRLHFPVLSSVQ